MTITVQNLAWLAGPFLIGLGIDVAVPALLDGDPWPLVWITTAMVGAAVLDTVLRFLFLTRSGRVGQAVLLTLRRRVFTHVQRLPLSFHERYTSGKTISRLTSDVEALAELLDEGLDNLVTALFSVLAIGVVLVVLDPPLAWSPCSASRAVLAGPLVPAELDGGLPAHPGDDRRPDRAVHRDVRRHPGGAGVPPRAAQRRAVRRAERGQPAATTARSG